MKKSVPPGHAKAKVKSAKGRNCNLEKKREKILEPLDALILKLKDLAFDPAQVAILEKFRSDFGAMVLPVISKKPDDDDNDDEDEKD